MMTCVLLSATNIPVGRHDTVLIEVVRHVSCIFFCMCLKRPVMGETLRE